MNQSSNSNDYASSAFLPLHFIIFGSDMEIHADCALRLTVRAERVTIEDPKEHKHRSQTVKCIIQCLVGHPTPLTPALMPFSGRCRGMPKECCARRAQ